MDQLEQHGRALEEFDRRVHDIGEDRWHDPTPCTEWDVRTLVNHLVVEQLWVPELLSGATLEQVGDRFDGDQLDDDPVSAWEHASQQARDALLEEGSLDGTVHTSMGALPRTVYVGQLTMDLAIHAWDLARAIGADERLDPELVDELYASAEAQQDELAASGVFAAPRPTAPTADTQTRLLALLGRSR